MQSTNQPLLTIGLPFFNPGRFFEDCIKSVLAQTFEDWELLLVDDGSSDGSLEFAKSLDDPRVKVIADGQNRGLSCRLNQITELARGKFIARMDADDIMHPSRLARQIDILMKNEEIDAVTTGCCYIDMDGDIRGVKMGDRPTVDEVFLRGGYLHASLVARKSFFERMRYDETFRRAEDRDLFVRCILGGAKIEVIRDALYYYRWVGNVRWRLWLRSYWEERRIILKYGHKYSKSKAVFWYLRSLVKSLVLLALVVLRCEQRLARRHAISVTPDEVTVLRSGLDLVRACQIKTKRRGCIDWRSQ